MSILKKLNVREVINADGRMSILGVSTISDEVANSLKEAGQNYFVMEEYVDEVDKKIAKLFGYEGCHIVNSASAGIALAAAALIYNDKIHDVNKSVPIKSEIIIPKGHNIDFGSPIEDILYLIGATVVEAGYANVCTPEHLEYRISPKTAAIFYVVSHHCVQKQMLTLTEAINVAKSNGIPIFIDCASEEELEKYSVLKADAVIFSGSKSIEGPTSGVVFGNLKIIDNIKKMHTSIGRTMKIGKESILGIYSALLAYKNKTERNIDYNAYLDIFKNSKYYEAELNKDGTRDFYRVKIIMNPNNKIKCEELSKLLRKNKIAIYLRDYFCKQGWMEIDLRSINLEQAMKIKSTINQIMEG